MACGSFRWETAKRADVTMTAGHARPPGLGTCLAQTSVSASTPRAAPAQGRPMPGPRYATSRPSTVAGPSFGLDYAEPIVAATRRIASIMSATRLFFFLLTIKNIIQNVIANERITAVP